MVIGRNIADKVRQYLAIFPAVGLIGPRQVGKTTLAKHILRQEEFLYLDLESAAVRSKISDPMLYFEPHKDKCIVLDEVQQMPELFDELRGIIDEDRRLGRFILLGSSSPTLMRKSADTLAGRIGYLELPPFTLAEVGYTELVRHWTRGGFPLSFLAGDDSASAIWRKNFVQTYVERDLGMLGLNAEPRLVGRFLRMLATFHGNIWNAENFARSLGITRPTVNRYLDFLDGAFLVRVLQPWYKNEKKRLVKSPKVYIRDSGLLHSLLVVDTYETLLDQPQVGYSWEGYVIEQILNSAQGKFTAYFYGTHQGAECDLVLEKGGKVHAAIEVKHTSAPKVSQGFRNSIADTKAGKAFIIARADETYYIEKGIQVSPLEHFMSQILPTL